jgi:hypothetical protein
MEKLLEDEVVCSVDKQIEVLLTEIEQNPFLSEHRKIEKTVTCI